MKLILYMAAGIPVICSPIGVNAEIVKDGYNGFHATSENDWYLKLERLLTDAQAGRRFAAEGREVVVRHYSISSNLSQIRRAWGIGI